MATPQQNADSVRKMYDAFGKGDVAAILDQLHDDVEWGAKSVATEVPWLTWRKGKSEVQGFFTALASNIAIDVFRPELFVCEGDSVVVKLHIEGVIGKTGARNVTDTIHLWTFRAGKVARYQQFDDTAAARAAWKT